MRKILLATAAGFAAMVADGVTPARAQSAAEVSGQTPQPGLTGYVQGRFRFYGAVLGQDGRNQGTAGKVSNFNFFDNGRFWIGADGVAENGLRYGARLEVRMKAGNNPLGDVRGELFFRRVTGYVGTPTLGQLRFGSGQVRAVEQMAGAFHMGRIGTGLWDGDLPGQWYTGQGGEIPNRFWFNASGVPNNASSIGYYTPQFFGFDAGISFTPNSGNLQSSCGSLANCDLTSSLPGGSSERIRNAIDAVLRYRGTFGPAGVGAIAGVRTSQVLGNSSGPQQFRNPTAYIVGANVSWAGVIVGGLIDWGRYNGNAHIAVPKSGFAADTRRTLGWQINASYDIGALRVGAAFHQRRSAGQTVNPNAFRERGFGVGASYALAPGLSLFADYLWGRVSESGRDFNTAQAGTQDRFKVQGALLGIGLAW